MAFYNEMRFCSDQKHLLIDFIVVWLNDVRINLYEYIEYIRSSFQTNITGYHDRVGATATKLQNQATPLARDFLENLLFHRESLRGCPNVSIAPAEVLGRLFMQNIK